MPKKQRASIEDVVLDPFDSNRAYVTLDNGDIWQLAPGAFTGKRVLVTTLGHVGKAMLRRDDGMYQVWFIDFEHADPAPAQKTIWAHESELETTGLPMSWSEGESSHAD